MSEIKARVRDLAWPYVEVILGIDPISNQPYVIATRKDTAISKDKLLEFKDFYSMNVAMLCFIKTVEKYTEFSREYAKNELKNIA